MKQFEVTKNDANQTLEKYIRKQFSELPLSFIYKVFRKKDIKVNGKRADKKLILNEHDLISVYITDEVLDSFKNNEKMLSPSLELESLIIYEDENIILINKPRGLLVQKDSKNVKALDDMVIAYLMAKGEYDPNNKAFTPGPCHRLDRNTAGIVIFGKNIATLQYLMDIMQDKSLIEKRYLALVKGKIEKSAEVNVPLKKDSVNSLVKVTPIKDGGKEAITLYEPLKNFKDYTLLSLRLMTGRTHQIRVHLSYVGHPVIGDAKYGDFEINKMFEKKFHFKNQFLMASYIRFGRLQYPLDYLTNKEFKIDLPNDMIQILKNI